MWCVVDIPERSALGQQQPDGLDERTGMRRVNWSNCRLDVILWDKSMGGGAAALQYVKSDKIPACVRVFWRVMVFCPLTFTADLTEPFNIDSESFHGYCADGCES